MFSTYNSQGHTVLCEYGLKAVAFTNIELHYVMKDKGRQKYHQICSFDAKIGHKYTCMCVDVTSIASGWALRICYVQRAEIRNIIIDPCPDIQFVSL